jgi:exonuclease VII small subunit
MTRLGRLVAYLEVASAALQRAADIIRRADEDLTALHERVRDIKDAEATR